MSNRVIDTQLIPRDPGIYVFRNQFGEVIYVGKAKNLRKRVSSYMSPSRQKRADGKLRSLIKSIASCETQVVKSEDEALILEAELIKKYAPRYNILMRDDKRFMLIRVDLEAPFPRLQMVRLRKEDGAQYYGPFPNGTAVMETIEFINRHFGLRFCNPTVPNLQDRKHCHDHIVRNCSSPCNGDISPTDYKQRAYQAAEVLDGKIGPLCDELKTTMVQAASNKDFEKAAQTRDIIQNLESLLKNKSRNFVNARIEPKANAELALVQLEKALNMPTAPNHIECFDNSNLFGTNAVASMVCFKNGRPSSKDYRHFKIKSVTGIDDFASMQEIVYRRYSRLLDEDQPFPDLILIDGGQGQLHAAMAALDRLNLPIASYPDPDPEALFIAGLAKKQELLFLPGRESDPLALPHDTAGLKLLQFVRDEAHRFAITFHRSFRNKAISDSILDDIPGIGPKRKKALLSEFKSVSRLKKTTPEEIMRRIPGFGESLAIEVLQYLGINKK